MLLRPFLVAAALVSASIAAHAVPLTGTFAVSVSEGLTSPGGFDVANGNPFSGSNTASATFTYTGAISFSNTAAQNGVSPSGDTNTNFGFSTSNVSGYNGTGTVTSGGTQVADFSTLTTYLAASGSASNFAYGSYYTFTLSNLLAGTVLTIRHDDGVALYQGSTRIGTSTSSPTAVTTDTIVVPSNGNFTLRYGRENGTPSILQIDAAAVTPEPSSIALLGTGLLGMAGMVRRRLMA